MSTELTKYTPQTPAVTDLQQIGNLIARSGFFADARDMAQAAVKVMAGGELGIPPIASMMGIHIIKGKVTLGANLIASRIRAHGYEYRHKQFDNSGCVLEFLSKPDAKGKRELLGESSFTEADAKAAGLLSNDTYKKFPRNMYFSRAISNGARWYTPEVFGGAPVYTPEEMGAPVDEDGNYTPPAETREQVIERRMAEERAKAPYQATDNDLPANLGGTHVDDGKPSAAAKVEAARNLFKEMLKGLEFMKSELLLLTDSNDEYYRILGSTSESYGHANEIKSIEQGRMLYKQMHERVKELRARAGAAA
jgi:hypothetical protein